MPRSGLSRRFNELKRSKVGQVTAATLVQLAHTYHVSVQALTLRLEELRLIRAGTWNRLKDQNFQLRTAAKVLGHARAVGKPNVKTDSQRSSGDPRASASGSRLPSDTNRWPIFPGRGFAVARTICPAGSYVRRSPSLSLASACAGSAL